MSEKGTIHVQHDFPIDGEYGLRIRAHGEQAGKEPVKMALRLDGKDLQTFEVKESDPKTAKVEIGIAKTLRHQAMKNS